ncbi:MAG: VPS10 domain-containing protein [Gaiellaceae bacterium]
MSARVAARWARFRGRRFVLVGALVAFGLIAGALALPSSSQLLAGAVAPADPDAAAGASQGPNGVPHDKTLGGAPTVSREALEQAAAQAKAIHSAGGSWEYLGANNIGGRVTDVVVDPTQANTIYVASAGGGVWKSTDAGATYTTAWPNDYPQAIGSLARGSDGTLWAGTGEANASGGGITYVGDGVYRSTDGGQTWKNVGLEHAGMIGRIAVDPADPDVVLVAASGSIYSTGGTRGLYRTVDSGKHWQAVLVPDLDAAPYTGAVDVAFDPVNPNRVYATLWDHHRNSYLRPYGGIGSGLYVTDNALEKKADDVAWERIGNLHVSGPLPSYDASQSGLDVSPTLGRMGVAVAPSDHTRVYLITGESLGNDKGFFYSDNGDRPLADGGPTFVAGGHAGANPRFEWWFGRLFVDPVNKNHLFKMDVGLRRSSDGGLTWANVGGVHADQHGMAWDPNVPDRVYLGNDGGTYRSDANGDTGWVHGTSMPWLQEYHVAASQTRPNRIAIGLQDNGSNRSWSNLNDPVPDPVAATWTSYGGGDGHYVVIDWADDTYYYSCSQNAGCSGVHDVASITTTLSAAAAAGATNAKVASVTGLVVGNTITIDSTGANPETVTMTTVGTSGSGGTGVTFTPALAFAHASGAVVVKNGVAGTQALPFGSRGSGLRCTTDAPLVQDPSSSTTLYLGCNNLSRSTNRGATWTQIAPPDLLTGPAPADDSAANNPLYAGQFPSISTIAPSKSAPNTIYAGTDNGRLWRTTDLGVTWQEFPNPFAPDPPRWVTSVIVDPADSTHAYASYGGFREGYTSANVYESSADADGLITWKNVSGNMPNAPVNFLAYDRQADVVYAATDLGVFFMAGDSKRWKRLGDNLPNTATEDLKIQASSGSLYVGTFGRGTWRIPLIPGTPRYDAQVVAGIDSLSDKITDMNLDAQTTKHLLHSVGEIREKVLEGENQCKKLDELEKHMASLVPKKLTAAQRDQLTADVDAIKAQAAC